MARANHRPQYNQALLLCQAVQRTDEEGRYPRRHRRRCPHAEPPRRQQDAPHPSHCNHLYVLCVGAVRLSSVNVWSRVVPSEA